MLSKISCIKNLLPKEFVIENFPHIVVVAKIPYKKFVISNFLFKNFVVENLLPKEFVIENFPHIFVVAKIPYKNLLSQIFFF